MGSAVSEEAGKDAASALKLVSFEELKKQKNDFTFVREPTLEETVKGEDTPPSSPLMVLTRPTPLLTFRRDGREQQPGQARIAPASHVSSDAASQAGAPVDVHPARQQAPGEGRSGRARRLQRGQGGRDHQGTPAPHLC